LLHILISQEVLGLVHCFCFWVVGLTYPPNNLGLWVQGINSQNVKEKDNTNLGEIFPI